MKRNANFSRREKFWEGDLSRKDRAGVRLGWRYQAGLIRIQPHREVL